MDDDNDIKFRDQCAIQILQAIIIRKGNADSTINGLIENIDKDSDYSDFCFKKIEKYARISYKIADIMRKARIASFK